MNADKIFVFNLRLSAFIGGLNSFGYSQYCHWPVDSTYAESRPFVTACATMQSARFFVRTHHQL